MSSPIKRILKFDQQTPNQGHQFEPTTEMEIDSTRNSPVMRKEMRIDHVIDQMEKDSNNVTV